jgi:pimeloyl-ACP methyl ester carboxylesterase
MPSRSGFTCFYGRPQRCSVAPVEALVGTRVCGYRSLGRQTGRGIGQDVHRRGATTRRMIVISCVPASNMSKAEKDMTTSIPFGALKQVDTGILNVGYAEAGPAGGRPVMLLHGWPYDIHSFAEATPLLAAAGYRVIVPFVRGYGTTRFVSDRTPRNGQQAALAADVIAHMDALGIETAILAGFDWGARSADVVAALFPERCQALVSVSGYLIGSQAAGQEPLPPRAELAWWYQFYFATERGRAGYDEYRREFSRLIWQLASPEWAFDDATFTRSAAAFDNPDHVAIVIHNYRWRLGLAAGEPQYDELERQLAGAPAIAVPTITLEGDANGAPHPDASAYAGKFTGKYEHRVIGGGVGHNLPQEAPQAFARAVIDVDGF